MSYTKTTWVNDTAPALNETNLNKIEQGIYDNDSAIATINGKLNGESGIGDIVVDSIRTKNRYNGTYFVKRYVKKSDGALGNSNNWSATDYIEIKPNTTYIYSGVTNESSNVAGTCFYNNNKTFISNIEADTYTFTTPSTAKYVRISLNTETPSNIQLEEGSTATTYSEYQNLEFDTENAGDMIVNSVNPKNLLDINGFTPGKNTGSGVFEYNADTENISTTSNSITLTTKVTWRGVFSDYIPVTPGTYTYSGQQGSTAQTSMTILFFNTSKTYQSDIMAYNPATNQPFSKDFTVTADGYIILVLSLATARTETYSNLQIKRNDTSTNYVPYQGLNGTIIESISNANGTAIKYSNGVMICTSGRFFSNIAVNSAWGSLYDNQISNAWTFPVPFYSTPNVNATLGTDGWAGIVTKIEVGKTSVSSLYIARPQSTTGAQFRVYFTAVGRWRA